MKKLLTVLGLVSGLCAPATLTLEHLYPMTLQVTDVDRAADTITLTDYRGWDWKVEGAEDWMEGDYASAIFFDNGTSNCQDDCIVKLRYERIDMLGGGSCE